MTNRSPRHAAEIALVVAFGLSGLVPSRPAAGRIRSGCGLSRERPVGLRSSLDGQGSALLDRAEAVVRRAAGVIAFGAAALAAPGIVGSTRADGPAVGHPERVFTPARLLLLTLGWVGMAAVAWRPLPIRPSPRVRAALLVGGSLAYVVGFVVAIAGRVALGRNYRPSSTIGVALEPEHQLVTHGPYRLVRHPMYLGLALAALGALAVYRTWSALLFVLQTPVLVVRAQREDLLLAQTYGEAWQRYAERVPGWLPKDWIRWGRGAGPALDVDACWERDVR